jgi:hypothetical protein
VLQNAQSCRPSLHSSWRPADRHDRLQLRITWEEVLKRFDTIEVVEEPKRIYSNFVKGYETLPVRIPGQAGAPARNGGVCVLDTLDSG